MARLHLEVEAHWVPKEGSGEAECQDVAAYTEQGPVPRFVVADGATGGYDSQLWSTMLVRGFLDDPPTHRDRDAWARWLRRRREEWRGAEPATFPSLFHEEAWRRGSYATFLGVAVRSGATTSWEAVAIGDTVLVHLRDGEPVAVFPHLEPDDFGVSPDLVHTSEEREAETLAGLQWSTGDLAAGDVLLGLTDAVAEWALRAHAAGRAPFPVLAALDEPGFARLVAALRSADEVVNDDLTLLRAGLVTTPTALASGAVG